MVFGRVQQLQGTAEENAAQKRKKRKIFFLVLRLGRRIRRLVRGFLTEPIDRDVVKRASLEAFFGVFRQL